MKKIYLAHLYSLGAKQQNGRYNQYLLNQRFEHANFIAAIIMKKFGYCIFSPISHSHLIQQHCGLKSFTHHFWLQQDKPYLEWCDELWIAIDKNDPYQWQHSIGIRWEKYITSLMKKPIQEVWITEGLLYHRKIK